MKKIIIFTFVSLGISLFGITYGAVQSDSCGNFPSSGGCESCFRETSKLYTCNPYNSSCIKEGVTNMYDIARNTGTSGNLVMYDGHEGSIYFTPLQGVAWSKSAPQVLDMFQFPAAYVAGRQNFSVGPSSAGYLLTPGSSVRWIEFKPNQWLRPDLVQAGTSTNSPAMRVDFIPRLYYSATNYLDHKQCVFYYVRFCGDGTRDTDKSEQCDDGNMNSGDGCSNTCQTEVTPVCNSLTVTPTSVTNGGTVTYTCSGTNATSYSIIAKKPDGTTLTSSTSAAGSIILPISPAGTYTISCYINGQVSTPAACEKTVTNTVVNEAVCTGLTISPTSVTNGGNVTYTCTGNNTTSYSVVLTRPDGTTVQSLTSSTGTLTVPASPSGVYTASCYVNGQTTTPTVCQKTVTNTVINEAVCTDLSVTPTSLTNGGNVTYTCSGNNVSSYSVVFTKPDGTVFQSLTTSSGSVTIPASPTGSYIAKCYVNGQTTTPAACQKTVSNNESICTGLTVTPPSVVNGGNVSYSCTGNNVSSYSVIFKKPDGTTLQSFTTPTGSVAIPATPLGTYSAQCFVNGQTTTPADCTKTVSNNTVITPTCDNLSVTTSGTTVNYSCTGSNVSSYSIHQNGSQISTSPSGTLNVGYGTHTFTCYVNGSITSASCQKTVTINNPTTPAIQVVKDDNDNHDDFQLIQNGLVQFTVVVRNPGSEPLENVTLSDPSMPECDRNATETQNMIVNVGNRDYRLDPGESFSYLCTRPNVNQGTFPNNVNNICVSGRGTPSGTSVNSCDTSRVGFDIPNICQYIQVSQSGNQANVSCSPNGGYKLFVLQGQQVMNTYQNPNGQFNITLNDGSYKIVCLRDGEQTVQPNCQKTITVNPRQDYCTLESTVRYGGAPLHTELNCRSTNAYAQCAINVMKDGQPWRTINDCYASMVFTEKGIYDATCVIENVDTQNCNTRVQVDIMTFIPTGPFLPTIIFLAIGMAGYITYRRRKIV